MTRRLNAAGTIRRRHQREAAAANAAGNPDAMIVDSAPPVSDAEVNHQAAVVANNASATEQSTAVIRSVAEVQAAVDVATATAAGNMSQSFSLMASQSAVGTVRFNLPATAAAATSTTTTSTTTSTSARTTAAQSAKSVSGRKAAAVMSSHQNADSTDDDDGDDNDNDNDSVASCDQLVTRHATGRSAAFKSSETG